MLSPPLSSPAARRVWSVSRNPSLQEAALLRVPLPLSPFSAIRDQGHGRCAGLSRRNWPGHPGGASVPRPPEAQGRAPPPTPSTCDPGAAREGHTPQAPHLTGALAPSPRALDFRRQRGCCWPPTPTFWLEAAGKGWIQRGGRYITAGLTPGAHPTPRLDGSVSGGGAVTCPPSAGWWVPPPPWVAQGSGFLQSPGQEGLAT